MNMTPRPPIPSFIPESAPFSPEQRTWLNGLFAGLFGLEGNITPLSAAEAAKLIPGLIDGAVAPVPAEADDGAPWHDPAMPLPERMKLADGKPLPRRLMAAMGQQDCGQCGYNCQDYAGALFAKSEKRLNLCVPGGKETARMLRELYQELDGAPAAAVPPREAKPVLGSRPGRSRDNPVDATFLSRRRLNKPGSEKETWHIDVDLTGSDLDYVVGDCLGIFPANDPDLVTAVLAALDAPPEFPIAGRMLREVLTDGVALSPAPDMLFQLISYLTGGERKQKARRLAAGEDPDGDGGVLDVLAALHKFPGIRPDPEAFIEALDPLQPRVSMLAGGTSAAAWKAELLSAAGAQVDVYAEEISAELRALADAPPRGSIMLHRRAWIAGDLGTAAVAVGAFADEADAARFAQAARKAGVPVNVIDKPAFCDFAFGAIVNRSPLVIGISTDGAAPVFAQAIRARLEMLLPKGFAAWAGAAQHWRSAVKAAELTFPARCAFWRLFAKHAVTHAESAPTGADLGRLMAAVQKEGAAVENGSVIIVDAPADPDLLTVRAVRALQTADVIVFDGRVSPEVLDFARREARKFLVGEAGFAHHRGRERDRYPDGRARDAWQARGAAQERLPGRDRDGTTTRGMFSLAAAPGSSANRSAAGL
jgi:siroheme synthase-like protein